METRKGKERNGECVEKATGMIAAPLQPQVNPTEAAVRKLGRKCGWTKHTPPHPVGKGGVPLPTEAGMPQPCWLDATHRDWRTPLNPLNKEGQTLCPVLAFLLGSSLVSVP